MTRILASFFFLFVFAAGAVLFAGEADESEPESGEVEAPASGDPDGAAEPEEDGEPSLPTRAGEDPEADDVKAIYVIPVKGEIGQAILFATRRGLKDAIAIEADAVLLDMDTPGGRLDVTLEIMEMLDRFDGETYTYVNDEAISAGAFISAATTEIYFAPRGLIGAAAPVVAGGQEIPDTMRQKIMSHLGARIRSFTADYPYRTDVITAMVDADKELEIEGEIISKEGELLTLTATEAMREFGDPPGPLLGAGIHDSIEGLLDSKFGRGNYRVHEFEPTWAEGLAIGLTAIAPLLLGVGLLCLFFEIKTPGFGVIGSAGIILLMLVFFGHHLAGLAGMEPLLIFALGLILVIVEILFFPGLVITAVLGILLMLGALLWGMADVWPRDAFELTPEMFTRPLFNLIIGLTVAIGGALLLARYMPSSWLWDKMILAGGLEGNARGPTPVPGAPDPAKPAIGTRAIAVTDLYPSGEIEIDGIRHQAKMDFGSASRGDRVEVAGYADFGLLVRKCSEE